MESHVFPHGSAYRVGGDEYLILLPNTSKIQAVRFLSEFQGKLRGVEYFKIEKKPTVSIGICEVLPNSALTDREARANADKAHVFAKDAGRNRIATFSDGNYDNLEIVHP